MPFAAGGRWGCRSMCQQQSVTERRPTIAGGSSLETRQLSAEDAWSVTVDVASWTDGPAAACCTTCATASMAAAGLLATAACTWCPVFGGLLMQCGCLGCDRGLAELGVSTLSVCLVWWPPPEEALCFWYLPSGGARALVAATGLADACAAVGVARRASVRRRGSACM